MTSIRHAADTPVRSGRALRGLVAELARGRRVAFGYAAAVVVLTAVLALLPEQQRNAVVLGSSTNLDNLTHRPLEVLLASAFVLSNAWGLWQVPLLLWGYGAVERWLGPTAAVVVGVFGHVGATLFVATILVTGIERASSISRCATSPTSA